MSKIKLREKLIIILVGICVIKILCTLVCVGIDICKEASVYAAGKQNTYIAYEEQVNMYKEPSVRSDVTVQIGYAEQLEALEEDHMWLKVLYVDEVGAEYTGWVKKIELITYKTWKYEQD